MSFNPQTEGIYWGAPQGNSFAPEHHFDEGGEMTYSGQELKLENIALFNKTYNQQNFPAYGANGLASDDQMADKLIFDDQGLAYGLPPVQESSISSGLSPSNNVLSHLKNSPDSAVSPPLSDADRVAKSLAARGPAKRKTKKQFIEEKDSILLNTDDSELNEEELALKRKAQNRAAQRAFRERKETKLKDLEAKLLQSEDERQKLIQELHLIKQQNISMASENELLRLDKGPGTSSWHGDGYGAPVANKFTFPQNQREFIEGIMEGSQHQINGETVNKVYDSPDQPGHKVLAVGAVWDYLQIKVEEEDYEDLDIVEVMERLRGNERCHGYGPAYPLQLVNQVIEQVSNQ